jgi:hypothetical protein
VTSTKPRLRLLDQNLWTGELREDPLTFAWHPKEERVRLSYEDPSDGDWEHGVLWVRHDQTRTGKFLWKAINTPRTRVMMRDHLCMVCSSSCVRPEDGRIWWLFVNDPDLASDGTPITNLPPTCPACIPQSVLTCPRLVERFRIVTVASTAPYAVTADLYSPGEDDDGPPVKMIHEANLVLDRDQPLLPYALGKQPWLLLHDLRDEPFILP